HPEQMGRMQKLMEYYLPTTLKLVEAYVDFEKVEKPGQDIVAAKAEIQKTLGIINEAFEELLNNLFQDAVFDATTDAQVLQTMLSREGLRREMSAEAVSSAPAKEPVRREAVYEETVIQRSALDSDVNLRNVERAAGNLGAFISGESLQEEEEENPFAQPESEEPEVQVLRAPWES
ncbi:MAG: 5-bromo-4-chloroindolyl phosphate hydrolysis family protein, partial [Lachnospiraceae bacterium]|nr:5-bromo-4-chloroindolyl phosphate hydrolysis family protein [Lachnospiraceae bacterium]